MTAHDITGFIRAQLAESGTQWNLGTFGAIAEFLRDTDEPFTLIDEPGRLGAFTARGGIGLGDLGDITLFASETAVGQSWGHRVALCLPVDACAMTRRTVLTEIGPDTKALRESDRAGILFDMGLDRLQVDICIRTEDAALIAVLRAQAGRSLFEPGNPAMGAIIAAGPHRVFIARFGRCEVYQPIPPADGKSPEGPHTHVLPKLLAHGRTHAANELVPEGFVPCAHLVPAHPVKDAMGHARPWDEAAHRAFQAMLAEHGSPQLVALKTQLVAAIAAGERAADFAVPADRFARHTARVALRQLARAPGNPPVPADWLALFEPHGLEEEPETGATDPYGHA
jgi:hypothetical protein